MILSASHGHHRPANLTDEVKALPCGMEETYFADIDYARLGTDYLYDRLETRWNSPHRIKRYIHRVKIGKICRLLRAGETLLDIGRGGSVDGILGVFAAKKGLHVTISSVSTENLAVIRRFAASEGVADHITFVIAYPGQLPYPDCSFDNVVALHMCLLG